MSNFDENSNVLHSSSANEGVSPSADCSFPSPRVFHVMQTPNVDSAAANHVFRQSVQAEINGSQQVDAPNNQNLSGEREAASSREPNVRDDPGQAAFPIQASGGALASSGENSVRQGGPVLSPFSGLLVRPTTAGGVSAALAANLGLTPVVPSSEREFAFGK